MAELIARAQEDDMTIKLNDDEKQLTLDIKASDDAIKENYLMEINDIGKFQSNIENALLESKFEKIKDCDKINEISPAIAREVVDGVNSKFERH